MLTSTLVQAAASEEKSSSSDSRVDRTTVMTIKHKLCCATRISTHAYLIDRELFWTPEAEVVEVEAWGANDMTAKEEGHTCGHNEPGNMDRAIRWLINLRELRWYAAGSGFRLFSVPSDNFLEFRDCSFHWAQEKTTSSLCSGGPCRQSYLKASRWKQIHVAFA